LRSRAAGRRFVGIGFGTGDIKGYSGEFPVRRKEFPVRAKRIPGFAGADFLYTIELEIVFELA
jgi:hypothetical protein